MTLITNCLEVVRTNLKDYDKLAHYHYRPEPLNPSTHVFSIRGIRSARKHFPDPIGVVVYRMPLVKMSARNRATNDFFKKEKSLSKQLTVINKHIRYLARIIVDPRFHHQGLGSRLLRESLERIDFPIVETCTPIDRYNQMFVNNGFKLHFTPESLKYTRMKQTFKKLGLSDQALSQPHFVHERLCRLGRARVDYVETEIRKFLSSFKWHEKLKPGIKRTTYLLSKLDYPQAYLIWFNPAFPNVYDCDISDDTKHTPTPPLQTVRSWDGAVRLCR